MATTFGSLKATGTLVVSGALTAAAALAVTGALTGTTGTFSGAVTSATTFSGNTLFTQTGVILGDTDGAGCTSVQVLNGTVSGLAVTCP